MLRLVAGVVVLVELWVLYRTFAGHPIQGGLRIGG